MNELEWFHRFIGEVNDPVTLVQMIVRATLIFLIGVLLVRLTTPRIFGGQATPLDIIMSVIIGSNLSRTLTGNAPFFDVVIATAYLALLHAGMSALAAKWDPLSWLVKGRATKLVSDGEMDKSAMRWNAIGKRDLLEAVRDAGGQEISDVKLATLERGGDIEVILKDKD